MKALIAITYRSNGALMTGAKLVESSTKKDIRLTAQNTARQLDARLSDIIFDDSPYWEDYLANTTNSNLWI